MSAKLAIRTAEALKESLPDRVRGVVRPFYRRALMVRISLRMRNEKDRLRPSFLIIGAMKGGTTSLFNYLTLHPRIFRPLRKEIHYFDFNRGRPPSWYFAHFPLLQNVPADAVVGEASPNYLFFPGIADHVARLLPDSRIIVLLRDPVARAISHYHHNVRVGREERSISDAVFAPESWRLPKLSSINPTGGYGLPRSFPISYIASGYYAEELEHWSKWLERGRLLVMKSEDLFNSPQEIYAQTLDFLGIDFHDIGPMGAYNVGKYTGEDAVVAERLAEIYAGPNERLYAMLGRNFGW